MCCVMPPASRAVTLVVRIASRRLVLPWSTWPRMVITGGRGLSLLASSSVQRSSLSGAISASVSSTTGAASSSAAVSMPSSVATRLAASKSIVVLIDAIVPMFTRARMRSTMLTSRSVASSRTEICFGRTTGGRPSMTATAGAACSTGATTGCGRCGLRPRGRGPRCGGKRRGRALGNYAVSFCRTRAASLSSTFNRSAVTASTGISSAFASAPSRSPRSRQASSGSRYAPRPGALPRRSTVSSPEGDRTMRTSSRFARTVWQATHVRCGRGRRATPAVPFGLTAFLLLLGSQERSIFFVQLLLVRHRGLGLDLGDEVVTGLGVLLDRRRNFDGDRLRLRLRLWLELGADLGLAADVDAPTGELCGKPSVLPFLADRKRQLPVRDYDVRGLVIGDDVDAHHVGWLESVGDVLLRLLIPLDDVDLLAAELVDDRLHPEAALPDARAARVDAGLARADRDLGARSGLARDTDDLHLAVVDLRHLELEQTLDQVLVRAADHDLWPAQRAADLDDHDLAVLADEVALVRRLVGARQDRLGLAELHDRGARLEPADLTVDDVALAVGVLREHLLALGLAQGLLDHLLRGLRADAPEGRRGLFERNDVAKLDVGLDPLGSVQLDLELGVLDLFGDGLQEVDLERARGDVDLDVDVLFGAVGALKSSGDDVADDLFGEPLLGGELCKAGHEFSVHRRLSPSSISARPVQATKKVGSTHFQRRPRLPVIERKSLTKL